MQVKKNKKKTKTDVKLVQHLSTNDGKEPDDGKTQRWKGKFHYNFSFSNFHQSHAPHVFSIYNLLDLSSLASLATIIIKPASWLNNEPNSIRNEPSEILLYHFLAHTISPNHLMLFFLCPPGAWETKVSNREKKQQRRKDKGPEDSGSPGGVEAPKTNVDAPVATAPTNTKRNRGNHGIHVAHVGIWCDTLGQRSNLCLGPEHLFNSVLAGLSIYVAS